MILVDTSVLIDFFKGQENTKTRLFEQVLHRDIPFGISSYTYMELLQGARDEQEFGQLKGYLSTQIIYCLPENTETYETAAKLYYDLRRARVTPRSSIDVLIALTAMNNKLSLLHNDKDFDMMANHLPKLNIFSD